MREILFRAKDYSGVINHSWCLGSLDITQKEHPIIIYPDRFGNKCKIFVDPKTVGQYTGLTDKNGKKIFEGDIVKAQDDIFGSPFCNGITGKVVYEETAFFIEPKDPMESQWLFNECAVYEIIGNIHDNPELLKGGAE